VSKAEPHLVRSRVRARVRSRATIRVRVRPKVRAVRLRLVLGS